MLRPSKDRGPLVAAALTSCLLACGPATQPAATEPVIVVSSSAAPPEPTSKELPEREPPAGRAGIFAIEGDLTNVWAARLSDGRCVAARAGKIWLVPHPDYGEQPCNGDAVPLGDTDAHAVLAEGDRIYYWSSGAVAFSDGPSASPTNISFPFELSSVAPAAAGPNLFVVDRAGLLHRYDGKSFTDIRLDGSGVENVLRGGQERVLALTKKKAFYQSDDLGVTWKLGDSKLEKNRQLQMVLSSSAQVDIVLYGIAKDEKGQPFEAEYRVDFSVTPPGLGGATLRPPYPSEVTTPEGVPLEVWRDTQESLFQGRECRAFDMRGDSAVALCSEGEVDVLFLTDDRGEVVREVFRAPRSEKAEPLNAVVLGVGEILVLRSCAEVVCSSSAFLLSRADGPSWPRHELALPQGERVVSALFDRVGAGGFYLFTRPEGIVGYHLTGSGVTRRELSIPERLLPALPNKPARSSGPHVITEIQAAHVAQYGTLRLATRWLNRQLYLKLSAALDVTEVTSLDVKGDVVGVGAYGDWVLTIENAGVRISQDGGKTFKLVDTKFRSYFNPPKCGPAGCDYPDSYGSSYFALRWGSGTLDELLAGRGKNP